MECLASMFASHIRAGDCYCLYGAVGAGKSEFSRSFIRAVADDEFLPVPSPTFLLQNTYNDHDGPPIHHFDFYRLTKAEDFYRLNLSDSFSKAVCLMEWPERLQELPHEYLAVHIRVADTNPNPSAPGFGAVTHHVEPVTSSSGGSGGGGSALSPFGVGGGEGLAEGNSMEEEEDSYADRRPRLVTLQPHGAYWADKAQRVVAYVAAHGEDCEGLAVAAGQELGHEQGQGQGQQQGQLS